MLDCWDLIEENDEFLFQFKNCLRRYVDNSRTLINLKLLQQSDKGEVYDMTRVPNIDIFFPWQSQVGTDIFFPMVPTLKVNISLSISTIFH